MSGTMEGDFGENFPGYRWKAEVSSRVVGDLAIAALKELDQIAYIRYAIVYLRLDDLHSLRDEIDRLLES